MNNDRRKTLILSIYFSFLIIFSRLFYWQIIKKNDSQKDILKQSYRLETQNPSRGKIFDYYGQPLVLNLTNYSLSLYKPNLQKPLADLINNIKSLYPDLINQNQTLLDTFQNNTAQKWITLPTPLSLEQVNTIGHIPGIQYSPKNDRFYPNDTLAKNVTGFLASDQNGLLTGYQGLEGYYHKQLSGRSGFIWSAKDATNQPVLSKKIWQRPQLDGQDLHTSIRSNIQFMVEQKLSTALKDFGAPQATAVIMESDTGQIIAMASIESSPSASNIAIDYLFEPGSIFKPLTVAAALDTKSITTDYICQKCNQPRIIDQFTINNWDQSVHPDENLYDIIKNSDNIALSWIIEEIGLDRFLTYFKKLELDRKTNIDLQGESKPSSKSYWSKIDLATASFGQGFSLTPIQMITAFNSLANNGVMISPRVVINPKPNRHVKVFTPTTTDSLKDILRYNIKNSNLARLNPLSLDICGKSGTAQVAGPTGYQSDSTIASFIGFLPCDQAQFTMLVTIFFPTNSPWGATTAAPVWFDLAQSVNNLL